MTQPNRWNDHPHRCKSTLKTVVRDEAWTLSRMPAQTEGGLLSSIVILSDLDITVPCNTSVDASEHAEDEDERAGHP